MILPCRRIAVVVALALGLGPACRPASAARLLARVPEPGACQVVIDEDGAATALTRLNDPETSVFCVEPGDYRAFGRIDLRASGSEAQRRFLVFRGVAPGQNAVQVPERAIFESIQISGSWWVVRGLTLQSRNPATFALLSIVGGHHNVLDGNLVDGSEQQNLGGQAGILIGARANRDPATFNVVRRNVVRSGNASRLPVDYIGIALVPGTEEGADLEHNTIQDNEVYDWGDGIALVGFCGTPTTGRIRGTIIDGNDVYLTGAKRVDCEDGSPDPEGGCACAENGIDVKSNPGPAPELWTRVTNNRLWGFRPMSPAAACGGSGSFGQAITAGNACAGHLLVAGNVVLDAPVGIAINGSDWIVAANLLHDIRTVPLEEPRISVAVFGVATAARLEIQFNTIVGVDNAYDDMSAQTRTRCNAVVDNLGVRGELGVRGDGQETEYNFLYASATANFVGSTNQAFPAVEDSANADLCLARKRWTGPEEVCIPLAGATGASPHVGSLAECDTDLGAPFGLGTISYDSIQRVPEPEAWTGPGALSGLLWLAWRRRRRPRRASAATRERAEGSPRAREAGPPARGRRAPAR